METKQSQNPNHYEWTVNTATRQYDASEALAEMCGLDHNKCHQIDFISMVHPSHQQRVIDGINAFSQTHSYKEQFQFKTKYGYIWVDSQLDRVVTNSKGEILAVGHMSLMNNEDMAIVQNHDSQRQLNELITHYSTISNSLLDFLHKKDISTVILQTLTNLLEEFGGDRVYIFEYDLINRTQNCVYEVFNETTEPMQDTLQNIPLSDCVWWTEQLLTNNRPIICDNIETLIDYAPDAYKTLKKQDIHSIMVVPLITKDGVGGYMGIDMVNKQRIWSDTNVQWFQSLANIISLCIGLKKSEERAQSERAHYRRLYENMPIGFIRLEVTYSDDRKPVDFTLKEVNSIAHTFFNTTSTAAILNKDCIELNGIISKEQLVTFDYLIKTRGRIDGETKSEDGRFFNYTMYSIEHEEIIILIQDNTKSIASARALQKSEETLQNIYQNIPVGIEIYDKNGLIVSINDIELEIFGLSSKDDIIGLNLFDNPNVPQSFLDDLRNQRTTWCDFFYDFDSVNNYYNCQYTGKKHIILKGSILYDADNNVENYLLIVLDNTDSLLAKNKIQKFELLFNSIAEFSEVGLCQWNPSDNTITGTDQWYSNLSHDKNQVENMLGTYANAHPSDYIRLQQGFEQMLSGKIKSLREETRIKSENGWKWLRTNFKVSDLNPQDNKIEIVGISIDITELKNTEFKLTEAKLKAEESDRLKSAFLANMSHELRTPLNAIVGFSDLLTDTQDEEDRRQYMNIIRVNNDLLLQLISDILDISKIESGMIDINYETICLDEICEEIVASYPTNNNGEIPIIFETPHPNFIMYTDRIRLIQVICNLVNNSRKFTKSGSINIGYRIEQDQTLFYVRDTGIGITKDQQSKIFTRFIKINNFVPGTGLGLPICKSLVEKMGGTIWVESEHGKGSCFWFALPHNIAELQADQTLHTLYTQNSKKSRLFEITDAL